MTMVRGKVRVGDLVQGTLRVGSPTTLRFKGAALVDGEGRPVKTRPLFVATSRASEAGVESPEDHRSSESRR